jgi:hypothetical protein
VPEGDPRFEGVTEGVPNLEGVPLLEGDIAVPWEPGLLEWLIAKYPYSGYEIKELEYV